MAIRTRIQPLTRTQVLDFVKGATSGAEQSSIMAKVARAELRSAQERNKAVLGRVPPHTSYVDGVKSEAFERVKPTGEIAIEFTLMLDIFEWIADMLVLNSPVGKASDERPGHPGLYQRSHVFVVDYKVYDPTEPLPELWNEAFFANTTPYARKIERGQSKPHDNVYHVVAELANRRFGNLAKIKFSHRDLPFGSIDEWAKFTKMPSARVIDRPEWLRRQPAVVITPR